jgi:hypothetical protein
VVVIPPHTPVPITLGSKVVPDIASSVIAYLESHNTHDRIFDFDYAAFQRRQDFATGISPTRITIETIRSAQKLMAQFHRSLGMNENTALQFAFQWFQQQEATAPWHLIVPRVDFVGADPAVVGRDYDAMCELWFHFDCGSPDGIGGTQINKVLHQIFPDLVVIYDSKLSDLYKGKRLGRGIKNARNAQDRTNELTKQDSFAWEPLRRDMATLTPADARNIRQGVAALPCTNTHIIQGLPANVWASQNLSLVRLIDMVAWN